ncbi:hypothetical protein NDU88_003371, partial [Pleurodeles waltl]
PLPTLLWMKIRVNTGRRRQAVEPRHFGAVQMVSNVSRRVADGHWLWKTNNPWQMQEEAKE